MRKSVWLGVLVLFIGSLVFSGSIALAQQKLRVAAPPWIYKKFPLEEVMDRFEADHPGVKIERIRASKWSAPTYIAEWKTGSTSFDVFVGGSGSMLSPIIVGDWTEPLDDMLTGHMAPDKFVGGFLSAGRYQRSDGSGPYYPGIPFVGEVSIIGVNTKLMKEAGLWEGGKPVPIPSWDEGEFFGWWNKLAAVSPLGAHVQIWDREFMQYDWCGAIQAMTGTFLEEDGRGFDTSSDAAKKWGNYLQQMYNERIGVWTITDASGYSKWKTGAAGSFYAAQGHIMELVRITGDESDIAYIGWPGATEKGSIIWTHSVWMPKVSPVKELGKAFIREQVFSPHMQQWSFNNYGKLPVMKAYYGEGIEWFQDQMPTILAIANASKPIPLFKDIDKYLDVLQEYLSQAVHGRMSIEKAFNRIQEESKDLDFTDIRAL
ncbi:MAG: ABC transporter substrate-binding protein [bacterium]